MALFILALPAGSALADVSVIEGGAALALASDAADPAIEMMPTVTASSDIAREREFEEAFAPFETPSAALDPVPEAVDLTTFKPPLEKRKPVETPSSGKVVRSLGTKVASYYGKRFHGRLTANGERFNMNAMTAAHKTLPFGTRVRVTNTSNGRSVVVRINDRGPFIRGRAIDLSRAAASRIGMISRGHARVKLEIVKR